MPLAYIKILACLFVLLSANTALALSSSVVAVVNGELISYFELENRAKAHLKPNTNKASQEAKAVYKSVLDELIQEEILVQEARRNGISISRDMLNQEINNRILSSKLSEKQFYANVEKAGSTKDEYRRQLERQILISQLINANVISKIVVTDNDILEYYKKYEKAFGASYEYNISLILYENQQIANKFADSVKNKEEDFAKIAKNYSVGPQAEEGGNLGYMVDKDMSNDILYYVQSMNKGEITSLIDLGSSKAQVLLLDKRESTQDIIIDDAMKQNITEILSNPKREERYNAYINQINKKALVDIRYE